MLRRCRYHSPFPYFCRPNLALLDANTSDRRGDRADVQLTSSLGTHVVHTRDALPTRRRRHWLWLLVASPAVTYSAWFAFAYYNQEGMIFPGAGRLRASADGPSDPEIERVWITTPEGRRGEAWFKPGRRRRRGRRSSTSTAITTSSTRAGPPCSPTSILACPRWPSRRHGQAAGNRNWPIQALPRRLARAT